MTLELDHVFICVAAGAPEADALHRLGLREGSRNVHPGQGTANRRFFFENAYLELLWVADESEARSEQVEPTRLWQRWSLREKGACPFAVLFRPGRVEAALPFDTWSYRLGYLPPGATIEFARGVSIEEPELVVLPFVRRAGSPASEPTSHDAPIRQIAGVVVGLPVANRLSPASKAAQAAGLLEFRPSKAPLLELLFAAQEEAVFDLRPALPLIFRGVPARTRVEP